jgi:hypothetical protein
MSHFLGIDPGRTGAVCMITLQQHVKRGERAAGEVGAITSLYSTPKSIEEVSDAVYKSASNADRVAIEEVSGYIGEAHPGSRMFTFGYFAGVVRAAALIGQARRQPDQIACRLVLPMRWQCDLGLFNSHTITDWKGLLWAEAKRIYPDTKILKNQADAVLLAHWAAYYWSEAKQKK